MEHSCYSRLNPQILLKLVQLLTSLSSCIYFQNIQQHVFSLFQKQTLNLQVHCVKCCRIHQSKLCNRVKSHSVHLRKTTHLTLNRTNWKEPFYFHYFQFLQMPREDKRSIAGGEFHSCFFLSTYCC